MSTKVLPNLRYTKDHEWILAEGDTGLVGITDHAQEALGDIVFVDLPPVGTECKSHSVFGTVESVKAVSDLFAPASGEILALNDTLKDQPELVNSDPYGAGWLIKVKLSNPGEVAKLMTSDEYQVYVDAEAGH
jgi:glycine cleavage system H protein